MLKIWTWYSFFFFPTALIFGILVPRQYVCKSMLPYLQFCVYENINLFLSDDHIWNYRNLKAYLPNPVRYFIQIFRIFYTYWLLSSDRRLKAKIIKVPKLPSFSDRQIWTNNTDQIWSGSTLSAIPSASFGCIMLRKIHLVQLLGWLQQIFGCPKLRIFTVGLFHILRTFCSWISLH